MDKTNQIEDLQCGGLKIIQNKALYTFTSDSVILANFVKIKRGEQALEIGAGCGVISILLTAKTNAAKIVAFEMQQPMAELAQKNIKLNKLEEKIEIICDKAQNYKKYFKEGEFDVVFSNPPYMKSVDGEERTTRYLSRHDDCLKIGELCDTASRALKFGGRVYFVYGADRSCELISEMIKHKLEPKTMFYTENGKGKVVLVVIEAVKGGKSGVKVLPNLVTNDKNGDYYERLQTRNFM